MAALRLCSSASVGVDVTSIRSSVATLISNMNGLVDSLFNSADLDHTGFLSQAEIDPIITAMLKILLHHYRVSM